MTTPSQGSFFTRRSLIAAVAVPVLYFGSQLAAAPFYPGYSFSRDSASMLGTSFSRYPWIFNLGAVLTGIAALAGATGLYRAFRATSNVVVAWLIALSVSATGLMSVKADMFPLPDSRHACWGFLAAFTIVTPLLLLIGVWKHQGATAIRFYLALILVLFPFMFGAVSTTLLHPGTLQRLFALATFVPVGVVA
jgi:hypothetical membrane protein